LKRRRRRRRRRRRNRIKEKNKKNKKNHMAHYVIFFIEQGRLRGAILPGDGCRGDLGSRLPLREVVGV